MCRFFFAPFRRFDTQKKPVNAKVRKSARGYYHTKIRMRFRLAFRNGGFHLKAGPQDGSHGIR